MVDEERATDATLSSSREASIRIDEGVDAATDSFRKVSTSPNLQAHQGYTTDGTVHYSFDTEQIFRWNSQWDLVGKNLSPLARLHPAVNHLGDGDYHAARDELHTPAVEWNTTSDNGHPHVAVYDADDLSYKRHYVLENGAGGGASGVWVDGENDVAWVSDFLDAETPLYKYNLADYSLVDSLSASAGVPQVQGVYYRDGLFYLPSHETHTTHILDRSGTTHQEIAHIPGGAYEGVDYSGETFRVLHDPDGNSEGRVHSYSQHSTVNPESSTWCFRSRNADAAPRK